VADRYLASRGIKPVRHAALKWVASLNHAPTKTMMPALLAQFSDADGKPKQIHRTYLTDEGRKAPVEPCRMFMPGPMPKGGAIRLGAAAEVMGIAEGIETALSASQLHNIPVWATTTQGLMREWQPPEVAKLILVFGDNDGSFVGQAAAHALAQRLIEEAQRNKVEREVEVYIPPRKGTDWNDALTHP
jgi:putative DNA primase/helicase